MSIDLNSLAVKIVEAVGFSKEASAEIDEVKTLLTETLAPKTDDPSERLQVFLDLANLSEHVYVKSPIDFINGHFSVSDRKDTLKMPLMFRASDLIPDFNLASVNNLRRAKMGVFLTFVDFEKK